ncbi:hypothetical protein BFX80_06110 [Cobetia marina]|nr:hypothetical protein BFX80_06110 [Cobetia marina]POR07105.1 hypothetical protein BOH68_05735 [Cobetia sp. MM1IDA2H-1]
MQSWVMLPVGDLVNHATVLAMIARRQPDQPLPPVALDTVHAGTATLGAETISTHDDSLLHVFSDIPGTTPRCFHYVHGNWQDSQMAQSPSCAALYSAD